MRAHVNGVNVRIVFAIASKKTSSLSFGGAAIGIDCWGRRSRNSRRISLVSNAATDRFFYVFLCPIEVFGTADVDAPCNIFDS